MTNKNLSLDSLFQPSSASVSKPTSPPPASHRAIAIVGMECRTAGARTADEFWSNIVERVHSIREIPSSRKRRLQSLSHEGVFHASIFRHEPGASPNAMPHVGKKAYLDRIEEFDPEFFGITAKDARLMDPAQRLWLEVAYHALEDAGYGGARWVGSNTGVFVGSSKDMSLEYCRLIEYFEPESISQAAMGNLSSAIPGRFSYFMDFHGPSLHFDTACSSSLVAVHAACQAILNGECDQAVAGGVRLRVMPFTHRHFIGIESATDTARPFDFGADGTAEGEGVAAVVLKPLDRAISDRDRIYAVVRSSAVNHDGRGSGLATPNGDAQRSVILKAWEKAAIDPESIGFFEAHATATKVGDPIEIEAISSAFERFTRKKQFCAVGAVKSNIGHLYEASGIFGLIKTVKAIQNATIPPNLHFNVPNKAIAFETSPLYVPVVAEHWPASDRPRLASVSSFGISGVNCHVVLEEWTPPAVVGPTATEQLFVLSARDKTSLSELVLQYSRYEFETPLANVCATAARGRSHFPFRIAYVCSTLSELRTLLERAHNEIDTIAPAESPTVLSWDSSRTERAFALASASDTSKEGLELLANLYREGYEIDFDRLFAGRKVRTVSVPKTPFRRQSYWIDTPLGYDLREHSYFAIRWKKDEIGEPTPTNEPWYVLTEDSPRANEFLDSWSKKGGRFVPIRTSNQTFSLDPATWGIDPDSNRKIQVLNLTPLFESPERAFRFFTDLSLALIRHDPQRTYTIVNVDRNVYDVAGSPVDPQRRLLFAYARSLSLEEPNVQTCSIDCATDSVELLFELLRFRPKDAYLTLRANEVYRPEFDLLDLEELPDRPVRLEDGGCYMITGGLGGIGLEIAQEFSRRANVRLLLIGRNATALSDEVRIAIRRIEARGSSVVVEACDVTDREALKSAIDRWTLQFGRIRGIVHSAGVVSDGPVLKKTWDDLRKTMSPKTLGTMHLHELTQSDPPDFLLLFSSLSAIFNNIYQADYATANAFMDAFSVWRNSIGLKTICVNWPGWKEVGMAKRAGVNRDNIFKVLSTRDALDRFDRILQKAPSNVAVGQINLEMDFNALLPNYGYRMSDLLLSQWNREKNAAASTHKSRTHRKAVKPIGRENGEYSMVETKLCEILGDTFGKDEIDVTHGFYDLGGDSMTALSIYYQLTDLFSMTSNMSVEEFAAAKTIEEIAQKIQARIVS